MDNRKKNICFISLLKSVFNPFSLDARKMACIVYNKDEG